MKIEGRPLSNVLFSAASFYWKPQTYVWQPEHPQLQVHKEPPHKTQAEVKIPFKKVLPAKVNPQKKIAAPEKAMPTREAVAQRVVEGGALRKSWEDMLTGKKMSDKQFTEQKMSGRYEIFQKLAGDRDAARRVDYR